MHERFCHLWLLYFLPLSKALSPYTTVQIMPRPAMQLRAEWHENFSLFDKPMLNGLIISNKKNGYVMPEERVLRWLREQDPHVGNVDIFDSLIFRFQ
jgi:hypothetical protein